MASSFSLGWRDPSPFAVYPSINSWWDDVALSLWVTHYAFENLLIVPAPYADPPITSVVSNMAGLANPKGTYIIPWCAKYVTAFSAVVSWPPCWRKDVIRLCFSPYRIVALCKMSYLTSSRKYCAHKLSWKGTGCPKFSTCVQKAMYFAKSKTLVILAPCQTISLVVRIRHLRFHLGWENAESCRQAKYDTVSFCQLLDLNDGKVRLGRSIHFREHLVAKGLFNLKEWNFNAVCF